MSRRRRTSELSRANRAAGLRYEDEVADRMAELFVDARVCPQETGATKETPDVAAGPFAIECKDMKELRFQKALRQAERANCLPGYINTLPICALRKDRGAGGEFVLMTFDTFIALIKEARVGGLSDGL